MKKVKIKFKEAEFLVIDTKESFFLNVTSRLYSGCKNHRIIQLAPSDDSKVIKFYASRGENRMILKATKEAFDNAVTVKYKFKINPN